MLGALVGLTVGAGVIAAPASYAQQEDDRRPAAVVSLGDSYISGEGGRWQGNAILWPEDGDAFGTDRAVFGCLGSGEYLWCVRNPERVYTGGSYLNGCDRSDVAEIKSAKYDADVNHIRNFACSGAETVNVKRTADGGLGYKGEAPQADQLAVYAKRRNIKMIVVSMGGNDLGFSTIAEACGKSFVNRWSDPCSEQDSVTGPLAEKLNELPARVLVALRSIQDAMRQGDKRNTSYRLVLQSYPRPLPPSNALRYSENLTARWGIGGCPFLNSDVDWLRDTVAAKANAILREAAHSVGADFLDLQDAFDGHELCAKWDRQAIATETLAHPTPSAVAEWVRFVARYSQGIEQESLHPNAYGQQALGVCLTRFYATVKSLPSATPAGYRCAGHRFRPLKDMTLTKIDDY